MSPVTTMAWPVRQLLVQYGFNKAMEDLSESAIITDTVFTRLERDFNRATGFVDTIRLYQCPSQDTLVISSFKENKRRRLVVRTGVVQGCSKT